MPPKSNKTPPLTDSTFAPETLPAPVTATPPSPEAPPAPDTGATPLAPKVLTIAELQAQLNEANQIIVNLRQVKAQQAEVIEKLTAQKQEADADEKIIIAKMEKGLSRPQAVASLQRQKQYDASPIAKAIAKRTTAITEKRAKDAEASEA